MSSTAEESWLAEVGTRPEVKDFYEYLGVAVGTATGDEAAVRCFASPWQHKHEDRVKSCSINMASGVWKCHGCGEQGNAYTAALAMGRSEVEARRLARSYGLFIEQAAAKSKSKLPNERDLKRWRKQLWDTPGLIRWLEELKAWSPYAIRRLGLGWDGERIVFPIRSAQKLKLQGVVRYLPGGAPKTLALAGTKRGLFPAPEMTGTRNGRRPLFIVEGEPDAVSMWSAGVPAVAVPGAQSWRPEWAQRLMGRRLIVLCDCDQPGRDLAAQIGQMPQSTVVDLEPSRNDGWDCGDLIKEATLEGGVWQAQYLFKGLEAI